VRAASFIVMRVVPLGGKPRPSRAHGEKGKRRRLRLEVGEGAVVAGPTSQ
jgi:hypothetical protein